MKRISIIFIIFLLITSAFINVFATAPDETPQDATTQTEAPQETPQDNTDQEAHLIEREEKITDTTAKVIDTKEVREVVTGTVTDKVQEVTIEIIEGPYIGEEFTTDYTLSYDIDGKILAYELDVGDKVIVQIAESPDGHIVATVQDVARADYIFGMFAVFLLSIVVIGGKRGVKAIIGLLLTITLIYFILIKGIFKGDNAIFTSILTSMLVIVGTFIVIGGLNKKIMTAAIGTLGGVVSAGLMALIFNNIAKMSGVKMQFN